MIRQQMQKNTTNCLQTQKPAYSKLYNNNKSSAK